MTRRTSRLAVTTAMLSAMVLIASIAPTAASARPAGAAHPKKAKPRIAFVRYKSGNGRFSIIAMDEDGKHPKTVKSRKPSDDDKIFGSAELSPDGKRVVYTEGIAIDDAEIWSVKADGKGAKKIVNPPSGRTAFSPSWSPDGKKIVYVLSDNATFASLVVADANGKHPKQVYTNEDSYPVYPNWSPDGKRILFSISSDTATYRVATVKSSGGGFTFLTKPKEVAALAGGYSPDGKRIVFLEGAPEIETKILRSGAAGLGPVPRGDVEHGLVVSIKANGKGRKVIAGGDDTVGRVVYATDGKRIIASHTGNDTLDLCSHPLGSGPWKHLTHTQETYNVFDLFQVLIGD